MTTETMTVEAMLLLVLVIAAAASLPFMLAFARSQKKLVREAAERQAAFQAAADQRAEERAERLTMDAARKIEEQMTITLDRMHERIKKLEGEVTERDRRIDSLQDDVGKLHEQADHLRTEVKALKRRNMELSAMLRRTISQLERHEIKPDLDDDSIRDIKAEEAGKP